MMVENAESALAEAERKVEAARRDVRSAYDVHAEALREIERTQNYGTSRAVELTYDGRAVDLSADRRRHQLREAQDAATRTEAQLRRAEDALAQAEAAARPSREAVVALLREQLREVGAQFNQAQAKSEAAAKVVDEMRGPLSSLAAQYAELERRCNALSGVSPHAGLPLTENLIARTRGLMGVHG